MKDFALAVLAVFSLVAVIWLVVSEEVNRPDVYKSWSTKECVKVEHSKAHSCKNLPERYNLIWVH